MPPPEQRPPAPGRAAARRPPAARAGAAAAGSGWPGTVTVHGESAELLRLACDSMIIHRFNLNVNDAIQLGKSDSDDS